MSTHPIESTPTPGRTERAYRRGVSNTFGYVIALVAKSEDLGQAVRRLALAQDVARELSHNSEYVHSLLGEIDARVHALEAQVRVSPPSPSTP